MAKESRKIISLVFLLLIFIVGFFTIWNCKSTIKKIVNKNSYHQCRSRIESSLNKKVFLKTEWININGLLHKILGETIVRNEDSKDDVYKLKNGQIMYRCKKQKMQSYAKKIVSLSKKIEKKGVPFTYVQLPFKIKNSKYMPIGTKDYGNINADNLVDILRKNKIDVVDVRDNIKKQRLNWSTLFFKTDHHWLPKTGLWASGIIMKHIGNKMNKGVNMNYYDYDNYTSKNYKNFMLGSLGKKVGFLYDGLDDIEVLNPKFRTELSFWGKSDRGIDFRQGSFYRTMYLWDNLKERADFERDNYHIYTGGDHSISKVKNYRVKNGLKILWIRDSFSCVLTPFVSLNAAETVNIDLRRYKSGILNLCNQEKPDIVVLAYNPSAFTKEQFNFD